MIVDQAIFRASVLNPDHARPEGLTDGIGRNAGRRFDVYRNNVAVSLTEALETAFPIIARLLGSQNFRTLAAVYLRRHPPGTPLMMFYGKEMPDFLSSFEPTSSMGYLPDVARLELALRESYHAEDADPVDSARLQALAPDTLSGATFSLAPSLRLVRSRWPIHSIWRFNTEDNAPKPSMAAEDVLVLRSEFDPMPHLLPVGAGVFVSELLNCRSLQDAAEIATTHAPEFDLSAALSLLIGAGAITEIGD